MLIHFMLHIACFVLVESAQMYVKIFEDIDRLPQLYKYYHKCQKVSRKEISEMDTIKSVYFKELVI